MAREAAVYVSPYLQSQPASIVQRWLAELLRTKAKVYSPGSTNWLWVYRVSGSRFFWVFQKTWMLLQEQARKQESVTCRSFRQFVWNMGSTLRYVYYFVCLLKQRQAYRMVEWPWFWHSSTMWFLSTVSNDSHIICGTTIFAERFSGQNQINPTYASRTRIILSSWWKLRLRSTIQRNVVGIPTDSPLYLSTTSIVLSLWLSRQCVSPFMNSAAQNSCSLMGLRWMMVEMSGRVQSSQSIWLSRQAFFLLQTTSSPRFPSLYILNWSKRSRFSRQYLFLTMKPLEVYSTTMITLGAKNTIRQPSKTRRCRCLQLMGDLSSSKTEIFEPQFLREQLFCALRVTRVGWNCTYFWLAQSSVQTLKHFWKGMDTSFAWFRKAVMICFYSFATYLTMWLVAEAMSSRNRGMQGDSRRFGIQIQIIVFVDLSNWAMFK